MSQIATPKHIYIDKPVVIHNFFDSDIHAAISNFTNYRAPLMNPDSDVTMPESVYKYNRTKLINTPFFSHIHSQLTDFACETFGEKVKPSFSYLSMYEPNGHCMLHLDREQCRYTINYLISQEQEDSWEIRIADQMDDEQANKLPYRHADTDEKMAEIIGLHDWTSCFIMPNDAICYSGSNAWHYRPTNSTGKVNLVFFFFVKEDWNGDLV